EVFLRYLVVKVPGGPEIGKNPHAGMLQGKENLPRCQYILHMSMMVMPHQCITVRHLCDDIAVITIDDLIRDILPVTISNPPIGKTPVTIEYRYIHDYIRFIKTKNMRNL